ncbi:Replication factor A protein 2 [Coemansia sp. RSA 2705]|nr:Replication factor A protein 2 [Coemansia sp. RSA 2705]
MNFDSYNQQGGSFGYGGGDYSYGGGNQDHAHGQGGMDGGGWMAGGGGGDDDSKGRGGYKNQTLRPVTVKQLIEVPVSSGDMPVHIDGEEIKQITLVGVVRNIVQQPVNVTYSVEDGTGKIDVRMWVNGEDGGDQPDPAIAVGKHVRVYGELKFFNGSRSVNAHKIRAVTDSNEITYHGLEAVYVHLCKTRQPQASSALPAPGLGPAAAGMTPVRAAVLDAIKSAPPGPEGAAVAGIQQALAARFRADEVNSAVDWLINEGHLFTTIDDQHVQSTNFS